MSGVYTVSKVNWFIILWNKSILILNIVKLERL